MSLVCYSFERTTLLGLTIRTIIVIDLSLAKMVMRSVALCIPQKTEKLCRETLPPVIAVSTVIRYNKARAIEKLIYFSILHVGHPLRSHNWVPFFL